MHVQREFLISSAVSDPWVRWTGRARAAASTLIEAIAPRRRAARGQQRRPSMKLPRPGRRRSGERSLRDLDERDDHRHSKPRRQAQGLVRHGERQQGNSSRQPVVRRRVAMVVVRRGRAAQDYLYRLPHRLPRMPRARQGHRLDLRERISRPASLGGRMRRRSPLVSRRPRSSPAKLRIIVTIRFGYRPIGSDRRSDYERAHGGRRVLLDL